MKHIGYLKYFIIVCLGGLLCSSLMVSAEESASETPQVEFYVRAIVPDNQVDPEHTYFDLHMEASQKLTVNVLVSNISDREIQIEAQINSATTNKKGIVEYGKRDIQPDNTLKYKMEDIVTCDNQITVPANDSVLLALNIQMPEEEYEGILAGGITFNLVGNEEIGKTGNDTGIEIQNIYSYVLGIVLRESENIVNPVLVLGDIFYKEDDEITSICANIQNSMAAYAEDLKVEAWITGRGTKETLYQIKKENMRMAPNSNFDFHIDLNGTSIDKGEFTLYITAEVKDKTWKWERDFAIDTGTLYAEEAEVMKEENSTNYLWLGIVILIVLLVVAVIVFRQKRELKIKQKYKKNIIKNL